MNKDWVIDTETYPNLHLLVAKHKVTKEIRIFEISPRKDDREVLISFLKNEVELLIGFNIMQYDYPLIHFFITNLYPRNMRGREIAEWMKKMSDELVAQEQSYKNIIKNPLRKYRDLFKIRHYDNKAKMTSLKLLAFNLRMINIQELPFDPNKNLTNDEIGQVVEYCINDVEVTDVLDDATKEEIELRRGLTEIYHIDMTNFSDAKIGKELFVKFIKQKLGLEHIGKTFRPSIFIGNIVFDYVVFQSREFTMLLEWFKDTTISETKGVFNQIPFDKLLKLEGLYEKKIRFKNTDRECQDDLNIVYKGFKYVFGAGGIHGSIKSGVYVADELYCIIDIDVTSYYPLQAIKNRLKPAHLPDSFCDIYEELFEIRKTYPKKSAPNLGIKAALNIVYGKSNEVYSPFYDPQYTMTITINGQLMICMLSEAIVDKIDDITLLQVNTDGLTIKIKREFLSKLDEIIKEWERITKLSLEKAEYDKMVINNVNNYSARYTNGSIKRKGAAFMYKVSVSELELHKNHSMLVVPKAIEKYFYEGIAPEDYIPTHKDTYDFFKRVKLPKKFKLYMSTRTEEKLIITGKNGKQREKSVIVLKPNYRLQNITRYYVAKEGYTITKIMPPKVGKSEDRQTMIEVDYVCKDCNDLRNVDLEQLRQNINYQYYINKARNVINAIESNSEIEIEDDNDDNED